MRLYEEFGLSVSDDTIYRALKKLGLLACERSAQGLQAECRGHGGVQKNFAERVSEIRAALAPGTPLEVWFQDEMRVGQKNKLTYRWARKGSRPRAAHDQRTQSTYLFGAVCPERGAGAALVLPACNCEAMQLHLDEIATKVAPGAHAIVLLDQAGWHGAKALVVPSNVSLVPLPPRAPELNGQENVWQFMRQKLVVKPDLQILRRYRRPLLLCLEHTSSSNPGRSCPSRNATGQQSVTQSEDWYETYCAAKRDRLITPRYPLPWPPASNRGTQPECPGIARCR